MNEASLNVDRDDRLMPDRQQRRGGFLFVIFFFSGKRMTFLKGGGLFNDGLFLGPFLVTLLRTVRMLLQKGDDGLKFHKLSYL